MTLFFSFMLLPIFIVLTITPYLTKKTDSFGVTIPESSYDMPQIKKMRQSYIKKMISLSIVVSVLFFMLVFLKGNDEVLLGFVFNGTVIMYLIVGFLIYLHFHKKTKHIKCEQGWEDSAHNKRVMDTKFRKGKNTSMFVWYFIPLIFVLATIIITVLNYERMPSRIPLNYNGIGEVTNTTEKSMKSVLFLPIIQLYLLFIFVFVDVVIRKARQEISATNPKASSLKNQIFRRRWSLFNYWCGTGMILIFTVLQLTLIYSLPKNLMFILPLTFSIGVIVGAIILSIKTGQGGSRIAHVESTDEAVIGRDEDRYWKLGIFYYNPNDPAIFVEKRFGVGWTNNMARPLSWVMILGIIILPIVILLVVL